MSWSYNDTKDRVVLAGGKPSRTKKMTGTRFAAVLGLNSWKSPFEIWCEITKTAEQPFEDTQYTLAGKAIEPILLDWARQEIAPTILDPEQFFGNTYQKHRWDFFPTVKRVGGLWDGVVVSKNAQDKPLAVIECKTTKRSEDWRDGVPTYYALQGLLYAHLLGVDEVYFPVAFLKDSDYAHPERFEPTSANTTFFRLTVSDYVYTTPTGEEWTFADCLDFANEWWDTFVESGVSPQFDENRDKEILKVLRATRVDNDHDVESTAALCDRLTAEIAAIQAETGLAAKEKELKAAKDALKRQLVDLMDTKDKSIVAYGWQVSRSFRKGVDKAALEADGLLEKYQTESVVETLKKAKGE